MHLGEVTPLAGNGVRNEVCASEFELPCVNRRVSGVVVDDDVRCWRQGTDGTGKPDNLLGVDV